MKSKFTRLTLAVLLAAAAQPALAGVVYVPSANITVGDINRTGFIYLSNQDPNAVQGVTHRFIKAGTAGLPAGDVAVRYVNAGASSLSLAAGMQGGEWGMAEVRPGYGSMVTGARLRYSKSDLYQTIVDLPAISSNNVLAAGSTAWLMGVESGVNANTLTDLAIFNLGGSTATCQLSLYSGVDGTPMASNVAVPVAALSSAMLADFFGGSTPITVPAHSRIQVSCPNPFYVFGVRHNYLTGATTALLPTVSLGQSTLAVPTGGGDGDGDGGGDNPPNPPGQNGLIVTLPGTFLTCNSGNKFWRYSLSNPATAGQTFKRITVDVDVYHANWDPSKTVHIYVWLQNGPSWGNDLFSYIVSIKGQNKFKNQIRYGRNDAMDASGGATAGATHHAYFDWNGGSTRQVTYRVTRGGQTVAQKSASLSKGSFTVNGMFIGLGSWPTGHGPEALQYGWRYSNLKVTYFR